VNKQANLDALKDRVAGEPPSRFRAVVIAGAAGVGVAVLAFRALRAPAD
jgi:hypothetical protein